MFVFHFCGLTPPWNGWIALYAVMKTWPEECYAVRHRVTLASGPKQALKTRVPPPTAKVGLVDSEIQYYCEPVHAASRSDARVSGVHRNLSYCSSTGSSSCSSSSSSSSSSR